MDDQERQQGKGIEEEGDIGVEMRRLFEAEKAGPPPFFFKNLLLSGEEKPRWNRGTRERVRRQFFHKAGLDYQAWGRRRRQKWMRTLAAIVALISLLALALGTAAMAPWWPFR